jgi:hypothetical protein
MSHSYEEIRDVALDVLSGRESPQYPPSQYENLKLGVSEVFARREGKNQTGQQIRLDNADSNLFLEVFWELFRQGVITLGSDNANPNYPHIRVSQFGKRILENKSAYFFHDVSSYKKSILAEVPDINETTLVYLQEAMQAFRSGCILSASVMLGVATEHTFLLLLEDIEKNPKHNPIYKSVFSEKTILQKVNKFKNILEHNQTNLSKAVKEDLDTNFAGILSIIRNFRNQAGHPTGKIIDREQAYVLLHLFIPYCKKLYQLRTHFNT